MRFLIATLFIISAATVSQAKSQKRAYFINLKNGQKLKSPFLIQFGLNGMGVAPAGIAMPDTGHHHLLINSKLPKKGEPIPSDQWNRHFGKGQTETLVDLPPGKYKIRLALGDHMHRLHQPPVLSDLIEVTVTK